VIDTELPSLPILLGAVGIRLLADLARLGRYRPVLLTAGKLEELRDGDYTDGCLRGIRMGREIDAQHALTAN
jgi:hypothetical protein